MMNEPDPDHIIIYNTTLDDNAGIICNFNDNAWTMMLVISLFGILLYFP